MRTELLKVSEEFGDLRLDVFLAKNIPDVPSRNFVKQLIKSQAVTVNGKIVKAHYKVTAGEEVKVVVPDAPEDNITPENIPLDIFYEDDDILVINKPQGLMVHPATGQYTGTLVNALLYHCKNLSSLNDPTRPGIVHRLDKETSGLLVVAKNDFAHAHLAKQFEKREVYKQYAALVEGVVEFDEGVVDAPLGRHPYQREKKAVVFSDSKEAQTYYKTIKRSKSATLLALFPQTGRTHQLRVHMAYLKHPILGDEKYGKKTSFGRLALHAQCIGFSHPRNLTYIEFSSKIPLEFLKAVNG